MNNITPSVGSWFKDVQQGITFEVVAFDDNAQTVETQLIDGEVSEYDLDTWRELSIEPVEEPEDWRNGYELSQEDYLDPNDTIHPENWNSPVSSIETDIVNGVLDDL